MESYLLSKLGWSASQNQREKIKSALDIHAPSCANDWMDLLEEVDLARFSSGNAAQPREILATESRLVDQTEKTWKA